MLKVVTATVMVVADITEIAVIMIHTQILLRVSNCYVANFRILIKSLLIYVKSIPQMTTG